MADNFQTTQWSLVRRAVGSGAESSGALESLCQAYWYPLYAFIRRRVNDADAARDLTQSYFTYLFESGYMERADPSAGKFRSFLLVSVKYFLSNRRAREAAEKRRADDPAFRITLDGAEERYGGESGRDGDPEHLFDKRWATDLMDRAFARLAEEYAGSDQRGLHRALRGFMGGPGPETPYASVAAELGMTTGAVKVAVHRMRRRLGLLLRDEVSQTVARPEDVDRELRYLLSVVGN